MNDMQKEILFQFFACSFNEDWIVKVRNSDELVDRYRKNSTAEERLALSRAITELEQGGPNDQELEDKVVRELGSCYLPAADGLTRRDWLKRIAAQLVEHEQFPSPSAHCLHKRDSVP